MSSKFQPGEETFDDVSGHRIHVRPDDEETEGHRIPYNTGLPSDDDEGTEGHRLSHT